MIKCQFQQPFSKSEVMLMKNEFFLPKLAVSEVWNRKIGVSEYPEKKNLL